MHGTLPWDWDRICKGHIAPLRVIAYKMERIAWVQVGAIEHIQTVLFARNPHETLLAKMNRRPSFPIDAPPSHISR